MESNDEASQDPDPVNYDQITSHLIDKGRLIGRSDEIVEIAPTSEAFSLQLRPFDELRPEDRLELIELATAPNSLQNGKYLICQTIAFGTLQDVAVVTMITDPRGYLAMPLVLFSYSLVEGNVDDMLPPGSFVALKNPSLKRTPSGFFLLISENPVEVELLSKKRMEAKFPDVEWEGDVAEWTLKFSKKQSFWKEFEGDEAAFGKLKELGGKGVSDGRFSNAIRFYDMALDYVGENRQDEAVIQSNKAAALLGLGCFTAALKCAEAALEIDPENQKCNQHKTKALVGLVMYEEAASFLEKQFEQFPSLSINEDCKSLLGDVKFLASRKNLGPTKAQLLSIRLGSLKPGEIIPKFTGPLTVVPQIGDKGRGYVATEDIRPGQLLVCDRAFVWQAKDSNRPESENIQDQLKSKVANMLSFDPELRPLFYNLTAGREHGHLESEDPSVRHVDMERIADTLDVNAFSIDGEKTEMGLWAVPSLFNHSCSEHNCVWDFCGEFMTVKAIAEIKKGDELKMAYQNPVLSYEHRQLLFEAHGFICACKLCQLEDTESISVRQERAEILKGLTELASDFNPNEMKIKQALEGVTKLISLRKDSAALNLPLLSPEVFQLMMTLMKAGRHGDALPFLSQMYDVAAASNSSCCYSEGMAAAMHIISCHAALGDKESAERWMATLKRRMITFDGCLEAMRFLGAATIDLLKQKLDIDFFKDE